MKKSLLSLSILVTPFNSFAMLTKFRPLKNTFKQHYCHKSTQSDFQQMQHSNDSQILYLYNQLISLKINNDAINNRINKNLTLIEDYNNFILHHASITSEKQYSNAQSWAQHLEKQKLKKELDKKTDQLRQQLVYNNKFIFQNLNAIDHHFWKRFDEAEKRNKINGE